MSVDSSRAKGLATRFIRESEDEFKPAVRKLLQMRLGKKLPYYRDFVQRFEHRPFLSTYCGGSNKRPFIFASCVVDGKPVDHGDWVDELVDIEVVFLDPLQTGFDLQPGAGFSISKHVLQRLYQRVPLPELSGADICREKIMSQLEFCEICAFYWVMTFTRMELEPELRDKVSVPMPAEAGLLLARYEKNSCAIRTFVGTDKLSREQRVLREKLIKAFEGFRNSLVKYALPILTGSFASHDFRNFGIIIEIYFRHVQKFISPQIAFDILRDCGDSGAAKLMEQYQFKNRLEEAMSRNIVTAHKDAMEFYSFVRSSRGEWELLELLRREVSNTLTAKDAELRRQFFADKGPPSTSAGAPPR